MNRVRTAKNEAISKIAPMSPPSRDPSNAAIHSHDSRPWVHCRRAWLRGRPLVAADTGLSPARGNLGAVAGTALWELVQPIAVGILAGLKVVSRHKRTLASRRPRDALEPSWFLTIDARRDRQR
jgi:hypothetical protein